MPSRKPHRSRRERARRLSDLDQTPDWTVRSDSRPLGPVSGSELADGTALERFLTDLEDGTFEVEVGDGSEIIATGIAGPR